MHALPWPPQVLGTHNSYHSAPPQDLFSQFGSLAAPLQARRLAPVLACCSCRCRRSCSGSRQSTPALLPLPLPLPRQAWQYSHAPLAQQLDAGVRALELDAYWDPAPAGLYGQAAALRMLGRSGWLPGAEFTQPGFKARGAAGMAAACLRLMRMRCC